MVQLHASINDHIIMNGCLFDGINRNNVIYDGDNPSNHNLLFFSYKDFIDFVIKNVLELIIRISLILYYVCGIKLHILT